MDVVRIIYNPATKSVLPLKGWRQVLGLIIGTVFWVGVIVALLLLVL